MHDNTVSGNGIKSIPCQLQRILKQRGQHLTIIVAGNIVFSLSWLLLICLGQAGTGKSTFINSLFQSTILDNNELINRRYTVKSQAPHKYNFRFTEAGN
jgi:septin family protein